METKVTSHKEYKQIIRYYTILETKKKDTNITDIDHIAASQQIFRNGCKIFLEDMNQTEYFDFIIKNILRVLKNPYDVENTFLANSIKRTILLEEVLLIFWRFVDYNRIFQATLFYRKEFVDLFVLLLYQAHETLPEGSRSGVFYLVVLILSKISADRLFSIQLRKKYLNDIGFSKAPIFVGSYIDLLFIVLVHGMIDSYARGYFCYQSNLLAILNNVSPFARDLCQVTCSMLFQLIRSISQFDNLKADKNNLLILRKTLNLIHKIICYQPETNPNLLYELFTQSKDMSYLRKLPLKKLYPVPKKEESASPEKVEKSAEKSDKIPEKPIESSAEKIDEIKKEKLEEEEKKPEDSKLEESKIEQPEQRRPVAF